MKIALFSDSFFPQINGVMNVVHNLAKALAERGNEVAVFTVSREPASTISQRPGIEYRVVTVRSMPVPLYQGERLALPGGRTVEQVGEFQPDVIHVHTPFSMGRYAYVAARRLGVPLVGTHHTFFDHYLHLAHLDYQWARDLSWKLANRYYDHCDMVITPTRALANAMRQHGLKAPVEVLLNPVPLADFRPPESGVEKDETAVYMGRLSREKSIDKIIEAYAQIPSSDPIRLVIIGGGPYQKKLEALAVRLGVRERVTFTGILRGKELSDELRKHKVFVTASKSENMPVSVLEAMASGLPIVAAAALGLPELVRDGENGLLVPPDDTRAMANSIVEIVRDPVLQKRFGEASREFALLHDPNLVAAHHEELYRRLISG